jgi:hypothetical protein
MKAMSASASQSFVFLMFLSFRSVQRNLLGPRVLDVSKKRHLKSLAAPKTASGHASFQVAFPQTVLPA